MRAKVEWTGQASAQMRQPRVRVSRKLYREISRAARKSRAARILLTHLDRPAPRA